MSVYNLTLNYEQLLTIIYDTNGNRRDDNPLYNLLDDFDFLYNELLREENFNLENASNFGRLFREKFCYLKTNDALTETQKTIYLLSAHYLKSCKDIYIENLLDIINIKNSKDPFSLKLLDSFLKDIKSRVYHELTHDALTYIKFNSIENLDAIFKSKSNSIGNNNYSYFTCSIEDFLDDNKESSYNTISESAKIKLILWAAMLHYVFRDDNTRRILLKGYDFIENQKITSSKANGAFKSLNLSGTVNEYLLQDVLNFMKEEVPEGFNTKYLTMYFKSIKKYIIESCV